MDIRFAYRMPVGSGSYVISKNPTRTEWSFDYNKRLAQTAEEVGFEYGLAPTRFVASHDWEYQQEAITITAALASVTKKLKLIGPVHIDLWHPGVFAKMGAKIDVLSGGRFAINIVSNWFKDEYRIFGQPWLAHDECHRRCGEFIKVLKGMWTEDSFEFQGDFFCINRGWPRSKPLYQPHPEIFHGGNSLAARRMAARLCDWYLINGNSVEAVREQISQVSALGQEYRRQVKFALNAFVCVRQTEAEAVSELEQIIVQPNNGFKSNLIGTAQQVAERIREYYKVGVDLIVCGFLDCTYDIPAFGRTVIPLVREIEARRRMPQVLVA